MLGLTFRQLQIFVDVVDLGSFQACAQQHAITQVSVSGHVRAMERMIGRALFERRQGATSELTEDGHRLYRYAVPMLETARELMRELGADEEGRSRRRLVATGPGYVSFRLATVLADFAERFPEYQIEIEPNDSHPAAAIVARGDADIGFHVGLEGTLPQPCEIIGREQVGFYVGTDHPFARRNTIDPAELAACPVLQLPRKDRMRDVIDAIMVQLGMVGNPVALQTANATLVRRTLLQGKAMACLFTHMASADVAAGDLVALPLPQAPPAVEVGVLFSRRLAARRVATELVALARAGWPKG